MATETGGGTAGESDGDSEGSTDTPPDDAPLTGGAESDAGTGTVSDGEDEDEDEDEFTQFRRAAIVTTCATLLGLLAGIGSMLFATNQIGSTPEPDNLLGFAILMAAVFVQFPLYSLIGIETDEFDTKTQLYVFAMTFFMWFISWTILLTTRALL